MDPKGWEYESEEPIEGLPKQAGKEVIETGGDLGLISYEVDGSFIPMELSAFNRLRGFELLVMLLRTPYPPPRKMREHKRR